MDTSPTYLCYRTLYDVIYVVEYQNDELLGPNLPSSSRTKFRTFLGDEGFEGHCEFVDGHHRSMRAWLTVDEIADILHAFGLKYIPGGASVGDSGVDENVELGNVLYFRTANVLYGYKALFVALPKGHHHVQRERQIKMLRDRLLPKKEIET
jgi:hypothetical protein